MSNPDDRFSAAADAYKEGDQDGSTATAGTVRSRSSLQMMIPDGVKDRVESTWSAIRKVCVLADVEPPMKNDFYTSILLHGLDNIEQVAEHLGISEEFEEYRSAIE
jgi:hypothetical protein